MKKRLDKTGTHRTVYESNKRKILKTQELCGICGKLVDKKLKYPDPWCGVIDHIIPIAKGGHPSDINNLQLTHHCCNRQKSDKLYIEDSRKELKQYNNINRNLKKSIDWLNYRALF